MQAINFSVADYPVQSIDQQADKVKPWEMALMFWILLVAGNPYFTEDIDKYIVLSAAIPVVYIFRNSFQAIRYRTLVIFVFMMGYELMHAFIFKLDYSLTFFKLFLVLLTAFATVQIFKDRFVKVLVQTMFIISLISFVFTFLCYVPGVGRFLHDFAMKAFPMEAGLKGYISPTLLIYTFSYEYWSGIFSYARNPGPFWEGGAFSIFLIITLYLHYSTRKIKSINDLFDIKSIVFIVAIVSTTSTTGFFSVVLLLFYYTMKTKSAVKYIFLVLMGISFYLAFFSVDFLGNKITKELGESGTSNNRFGSALRDWNDIQKRPILGSSRRMEVITGSAIVKQEDRRPNGLTNFLREYGIFYFLFYFALIYLSFNAILKYHGNYNQETMALFGILLLWIGAFSELVFDLVFFKALLFLSHTYRLQPKPDATQSTATAVTTP
jgi:hypothetical protein